MRKSDLAAQESPAPGSFTDLFASDMFMGPRPCDVEGRAEPEAHASLAAFLGFPELAEACAPEPPSGTFASLEDCLLPAGMRDAPSWAALALEDPELFGELEPVRAAEPMKHAYLPAPPKPSRLSPETKGAITANVSQLANRLSKLYNDGFAAIEADDALVKRATRKQGMLSRLRRQPIDLDQARAARDRVLAFADARATFRRDLNLVIERVKEAADEFERLVYVALGGTLPLSEINWDRLWVTVPWDALAAPVIEQSGMPVTFAREEIHPDIEAVLGELQATGKTSDEACALVESEQHRLQRTAEDLRWLVKAYLFPPMYGLERTCKRFDEHYEKLRPGLGEG